MRAQTEPKVHSFAPETPLGGPGRLAHALLWLAGPLVGSCFAGAPPTSVSPASPAAIEQRVATLQRHTAGAKGEVAALLAARNRLDARPSLQTCQAFGDAAGRVQAHLDALAVEYTGLRDAAAGFPDRVGPAAAAADALRRGRDALLANALAVTQLCGKLPEGTATPPRPALRPLPVARGEAAFIPAQGLVFLWGPGAADFVGPGGGLRAGRLLAGAVESLPEVVFVRVLEPATPGAAFSASFFGSRGSAGPTGASPRIVAQGRRSFMDTGKSPRGVVVLPGDGPLVQTLALYGIARSFADEAVESAGCPVRGSSSWMHSNAGGVLSPGAHSPPLRFSSLELYAMGLFSEAGSLPPLRFFGGDTTSGLHPDEQSITCEVDLHDRIAQRPDGEGPSVALLIISTARPTEDECFGAYLDWRSFMAAGPDGDPMRSNFFEATSGRAALRALELSARAGGCTSGVPDLP